MAASTNPTTTKAFIIKNSPLKECDFSLGKESSTFELKEVELPPLGDGQVLVKTLCFSNDPAQRGWIQKDADPRRLYRPPIKAGQPMEAYLIGRVIQSKSDSLPVGSLVTGPGLWQEYLVRDDKQVRQITPLPGHSPSVFIGPLGGTGLTAYFGLTEVLQFKQGQSIVVSGAAGATGSVVVQLAKHVFGASQVIGIVGSQEKGEWVKSLGADVALNYKDKDFRKQLEDATEDYVDAYFDNVGGEILDAMLGRIKRHGRVAACGAISTYNDLTSTHLKNWFEIITNRITVQGFLVMDYYGKIQEARDVLINAVKEGKLKLEGSETLVEVPFEDVPQVWSRLFVGGNTGKLVTQIASFKLD